MLIHVLTLINKLFSRADKHFYFIIPIYKCFYICVPTSNIVTGPSQQDSFSFIIFSATLNAGLFRLFLACFV